MQKSLEEARAHTVYLKETCDQHKIDLQDRTKLLSSGPELAGEYKKQLAELTARKQQLMKGLFI